MSKCICIFGGARGIGEALSQIEYKRGNIVGIVDKVKPMRAHHHKWWPDTLPSSDKLLAPWSLRNSFDIVYVTFGKPSAVKFDSTKSDYDYEVFADNYHAVTSALRQARSYVSTTNSTSYVLTSSLSASRADPKGVAYAGAKAGLEALVRGLAREWAPDRVNAVAPGPTLTDQFIKNVNADSVKSEGKRSPHNRCLKPGEVAQAMFALARLTGVSGVTLPVDLGAGSTSTR